MMTAGGIMGILFVFLIYGGMIALTFYFFYLLSRIVRALERIARALEDKSQKFRDETKP